MKTFLPIHELQPSPYNDKVRRIDLDAIENLQRGLDEFGLTQPIIVNRRTGYIVGGHQRWRAAKDLGWPEIWVEYVDLDDNKERALSLLLNNKEAQGETITDTGELRELVKELDEESQILSGYTDKVLDELENGYADKEKPPKVMKYSIKDLRDHVASYGRDSDAVYAFLEWLEHGNA